MTVNEWIASGENYKIGLEIYQSLPNHNANFLKVWSRKETPQNLIKLRYELQKQLQPTLSFSKSEIIEESKPVGLDKYFRKLRINELPVALHPIYIQQKNDFSIACSLKIQLNALGNILDCNGNIVFGADGLPKLKPQTKDDQEKALRLCLKIESLFDAIDKTWGVIDYYLENKIVPKITDNDFSALPEGKLRDKINSVRGSITRQNIRLAMLRQKYNNAIAKKFKEKYKRNLEKCENSLMQLNQDLIKLLEIRDKEK